MSYEVVPGDTRLDADKAVSLWGRVGFGEPEDQARKARYEWFHLRYPDRVSEINFLTVAGEPSPVGSLGVGIRDWMLDESPIAAGVLVDFVVHPEHRSAAPALMLQRRTRERALQSAAMLFGLPDTKAVAVFKRLGSTFHCQLPRYVRVLRHAPYLQRKLPVPLAKAIAFFVGGLDRISTRLRLLGRNLRGEWIGDFDERFDRLWQRTVKRNRCLGVRDRTFLDWRFKQQPGHQYHIFAVSRCDSGELEMYFVCEWSERVLIVKDCLHYGAGCDCRAGLLLLSRAARRLGAVALSFQMYGDALLDTALKSCRFVERDERSFFAVTTEERRAQFVAASWYVTQADEDI